MPPEMKPDEMGELQKQAGQNQGGDITKLAQDIAKKMVELKDVLDSSQSATDKDKQSMDAIIQQFVALIEGQLAGQEPGQDAEEAQDEMPSQVPSDQGLKGVPMGMNTRQ